eukprot:2791464-Rhodomonas_salina.1
MHLRVCGYQGVNPQDLDKVSPPLCCYAMAGADSAIALRLCYAMSGTDLAHAAICYAMTGTDIANRRWRTRVPWQ